ncbi:MAG: ATP synthase F0 subunit B [Acidobacteriota bacterium]
MIEKRMMIGLLILLPLFLSFSTGEEKGPSVLMDLLGKAVNFLILFGGLGYILAKPLKRFLGELVLSARKTMEETERARREAEGRLEAMTSRLRGLDREIRAIRAKGKEAGQNGRERMLAAARLEAEKIRAFTQQEIELYVLAAKKDLRAHAADLAVSLARAKIERRLTPELHQRLIDQSIAALGKLHEKSSPD